MATRKDAANSKPAGARDGLPIWKKVIFLLGATALAFTFLELILALVRVRPVFFDEDPYVGFSAFSPLFSEEGGGRQAVMVTAPNKLDFFNNQQFSKSKSAGTYRIFCMGGSTTYGRPYADQTSFCGWLRAFLNEADPSRKWEVINCGGISYASYRVAKLMEELINYDPDLFIIYAAHNEFLEQRTYTDILEKPTIVRDLNALFSRSRTYSVMKRILKPSTIGGKPFSEDRLTLPAEVDALLDRSIDPEDYEHNDILRKQVLKHYDFTLDRMVKISKSGGADIVFVAPASNLRNMSPFKSEHRAEITPDQLTAWQEAIDTGGRNFESGRLSAALEAISKAVEIDPRHSATHYLKGKISLAMGDREAAQDAFMSARDEDVCPLRASTPISHMVKKTAANHGAMMVDFESLVQRLATDNIPGDDVFLDHVHPTIAANRELALEILRKLADDRIVTLKPAWGDDRIAQIIADVEARLDRNDHSAALRNLSRFLLSAGKFDEAHSLAAKAVETAPENPGAHYQLAMANERLGRLEDAIVLYCNALELLPTYVDAHYSLGAVLARTGGLDEAQSHLKRALLLDPGHVEARFNLGLVFLKQGHLDRAQIALKVVVATRPDHAEGYLGLARIELERGQTATAREYLSRSLELAPDNAEAYSQLGLALAAEGAFEEAADAFNRALRHDSHFPEAHNNWGNLLLQMGLYEEAAIHFRQALQLDPAYANSYYNLGVSLAGLGRFEEAAATYQKVLDLQPRHARTLNNLGALLAQQGQFQSAIHYFQDAIAAQPDYEEALRNLRLAQQVLSQNP